MEVGGGEADEKWACSQHVYIAYTMAGGKQEFFKALQGRKASPRADLEKVIHPMVVQFQ